MSRGIEVHVELQPKYVHDLPVQGSEVVHNLMGPDLGRRHPRDEVPSGKTRSRFGSTDCRQPPPCGSRLRVVPPEL
jgi:hypothetical protein